MGQRSTSGDARGAANGPALDGRHGHSGQCPAGGLRPGTLPSMMGPSHALSGAAVWLAGSYALAEFASYHQTPIEIAVGTAMCAGGALLPDLDLSGRVTTDQGGATVAHTFGVFSLFIAEVVEKVSLGIYDLTRTRRDPHLHNGHRTFTHTLPFNVGIGFGVFELCL